MSAGQQDLDTTTMRRSFPIWPGVVVGLAVVLGLASLPLPHTLARILAGPMVWVHGIVIFAIITLAGEALVVARWDRILAGWLDAASKANENDLGSGEFRSAAFGALVQKTAREFFERWRDTRRIIDVVPYVVPLIGFGVSSWNSGSAGPWRVVGQPLLLSVGEAFFVRLLTIGVSGALIVVKEGWLLLVK
jgi:hypothetical protein